MWMYQDYGINNKKSKRLVFCFIHLNKYVRILLYQGGIMKVLDLCLECDSDIKTGKREKYLAFELFLIKCKEYIV